MIAFACEGCGQAFEVDAALAGRRARCHRCRKVTTVPAPAAFELAPEPPAPAVPAARRIGRALLRKKPPARQPGWAGVERDGWVAMAVGLGLAIVALVVPLVGVVLYVLTVIIHESGHTATAWLLASPAFPQFDLTYGGGYSHVFQRQPVLVIAAYAGLAYVLAQARGDRRALVAWAVAAAAYTVVMFTPLRDLLIGAMGHGAELLLGGVFLYRALGGRDILASVERPLYAMLGFFLVLTDVRFAVRLLTSDAVRVAYGDAKGGGHWMDFDRIATMLGWPLTRVAGVFLLACVLTPVAAYLAHRHADRLILHGPSA